MDLFIRRVSFLEDFGSRSSVDYFSEQNSDVHDRRVEKLKGLLCGYISRDNQLICKCCHFGDSVLLFASD